MKKVVSFVLTVAFVVAAIWFYNVKKLYTSPSEAKFYLQTFWYDLTPVDVVAEVKEDDKITLMVVGEYPDTEEPFDYYVSYKVSGVQGKKIWGQYYLVGDSLLSIKKAPYDTVPYIFKMKVLDTSREDMTVGEVFSDQLIYMSDDYFITDDFELMSLDKYGDQFSD